VSAPAIAYCSRCGAAKAPHRVCAECGFYKNRQVIVTESVT
jgi:large subunit ribosomal protein L32